MLMHRIHFRFGVAIVFFGLRGVDHFSLQNMYLCQGMTSGHQQAMRSAQASSQIAPVYPVRARINSYGPVWLEVKRWVKGLIRQTPLG